MNSRLDFCPRLTKKETNVLAATKDKLRAHCPNIYTVYEGEHVSHIVQLMTQPYEFKRKNSIVPRFSHSYYNN